MNEMRWELNDVWPQWTCVKRRIGAANCSKKLIKNREVETLPAGLGGTGNVPTVSGSWATNGEPWTLGWVSSRICTGDRREQEVMKQDGPVSKYLSCALCFKLNKQNSRPFIKYNLKDRKDKTQSMKVTNKTSCYETKDNIKTSLITKKYS